MFEGLFLDVWVCSITLNPPKPQTAVKLPFIGYGVGKLWHMHMNMSIKDKRKKIGGLMMVVET